MTESHVKVPFSVAVVFDEDGGLVGVNMTCEVCGETGYKGANVLVEHARDHRLLRQQMTRRAGLSNVKGER